MPIITETFKEQVTISLKDMQDRLRYNHIDLLKIIDKLSNGKSVREIAEEMYSSTRTMECRVNELKKIFRSNNIPELCCTAMRLKMIE